VLDRARERLLQAVKPTRDYSKPLLRRLLVIDRGRAVFLPVDRIDRAESDRNYVVLSSAGATYRIRATIASLAERLDPAMFLRINRSTLVRLDAVREMHEWSHGDFKVVMHDGTELTWSRRYKATAEQEFGIGG
jgi:two-component system LytT family response regulator